MLPRGGSTKNTQYSHNSLTSNCYALVTFLLRFYYVFVKFSFFITLTMWQTTRIHIVIPDILSPATMSRTN